MVNSSSVSITGMGLISPAGLGIDALWAACLEKKCLLENGLGKVSDSVMEEVATLFPKAEGKSLLMALYALKTAIDQAAWNELTENDAIVIGTTTGQIGIWEKTFSAYAGGAPLSELSISALSKQPLDSLSESLKKYLAFKGRIIILSSACSASTQAVIFGEQLVKSGRAQRVLAGGVEELGQLTITGFNCLKLLNTAPCTPFDKDRLGINLSEGAAFYTLEYAPGEKTIAFVAGGDTFLDSYHMTSPNPEGRGLNGAVQSALDRSGITPRDIDFVHAHGTGSVHNDLAESAALKAIFTHGPEVVSTKGVHGHALGASGALEIGICLKALEENKIPPVTGLLNIDPAVSLNLPVQIVKKKINYVLKTTLGFGGINSALVLKASHA